MSLSKTAKKHLGQNFLIDRSITQRIVTACDLRSTDTVLEIGPGRGALTQNLMKKSGQVYAIEKDRSLIRILKESIPDPDLHVIEADVTAFDFSGLPPVQKVIGNIPYNISTPIIETLVQNRRRFCDAFLTVQLEFAKRLTAKPNTKDYGALTCFAQYHADTKILFKIPARAFRPVPKVTSCFIHLKFREPQLKAINEVLLFQLTRAAFQQRRKKIINALSPIVEKERLEKILSTLNIEQGRRAENIPLSDYIHLANTLSKRL